MATEMSDDNVVSLQGWREQMAKLADVGQHQRSVIGDNYRDVIFHPLNRVQQLTGTLFDALEVELDMTDQANRDHINNLWSRYNCLGMDFISGLMDLAKQVDSLAKRKSEPAA
jgi:hypothetical protein